MHFKSSFCAALCLMASSAAADNIDRLATATATLGEKANVFYASRVPELAGKLPDMTIDADMRTALTCVLDTIETATGDTGVEAYVSHFENIAARDITSMADMQSMPDGVPLEVMATSMTNCGMVEISTKRMKDSGFWDAMQQPGVMEKLMALE